MATAKLTHARPNVLLELTPDEADFLKDITGDIVHEISENGKEGRKHNDAIYEALAPLTSQEERWSFDDIARIK